MVTKNLFKDELKDLDKPIPEVSGLSFLKKGKIKCVIHYEDNSYSIFYKKFKDPYIITIKKCDYYVDTKSFIYGKFPTIHWYYNNPIPIRYGFRLTELTAKNLQDKILLDKETSDMIEIPIDGKGLHALITSNLINKMYQQQGVTPKMILIFLVIIVIIVFILLQATGKVDIIGFFTGG